MRRSAFVALDLLFDFASALPFRAAAAQHEADSGRNIVRGDCRDVERVIVPRMLGEVQSMVDAERSGANRQLVATLVLQVLAEMRGALSGARADCAEATRALQHTTAASREAAKALNEAASACRVPTTPPSRAIQLRR